MAGFRNYITTKLGKLTIAALQSPNFVHGVSGWRIAKSGAAEFNSITLPPGTSVVITFAAVAPANPHTGDLWFDTGNGNKANQWSGVAWVPYQWGTGSVAPGSITAALIAANTITASQIAANTITAGQIAANTITASQIAANTITAGQIAAGTITASQIAANTITAGQIAAGTITAAQIAAGAIIAGLIAAGAIDGQTIKAMVINGAQVLLTGLDDGLFIYNGVASGVLNANPNFTAGVANWTAVTGSISYATPTYNGHDTMLLTPPAGAGTTGEVTSEFEAVTAGSQYLASFVLQDAPEGGSYIQANVNWYNAVPVLLSQSTIVTIIGNGGWQQYSAIVKAPAGATQMKLDIVCQRSASDSTYVASTGLASIQSAPALTAAIAGSAVTDPVNAIALQPGVYLGNQSPEPSAVSSGALMYAVNGHAKETDALGFSGNIETGQSDVTPHTALSTNDITKAWSVPAADWEAGTTFRLIAWGHGTQGSTARTLTFALDVDGAGSNAGTTAGTGFAGTGAGFSWVCEIIFQCITTGAGGTASISNKVQISTSSVNTSLAGEASAYAIDTTAAHTFELRATWSGNTATITSDGSIFERIR